jgi:hypothetical protein
VAVDAALCAGTRFKKRAAVRRRQWQLSLVRSPPVGWFGLLVAIDSCWQPGNQFGLLLLQASDYINYAPYPLH